MTEPATGGSQRGPTAERQDLEAVLVVRRELGADDAVNVAYALQSRKRA